MALLPHSGLYAPLDSARREIRLFELLPGRRLDAVKGQLRVVSLSQNPKYEALSYTWGTGTDPLVINVNGQPGFKVTRNLFAALSGLRRRREYCVLWVDAICINQSDDQERSQQVTMMGDIYQRAELTNVWLGAGRTPSSYRAHRLSTWSLWARSHDDPLRTLLPELAATLHDTRPLWHERAWTIQEFVLSRRVFLCFGAVRIPYVPRQLDKAWADAPIRSSSEELGPIGDLVHHVSDLRKVTKMLLREDPHGRSITQVAQLSRRSRSTDPRDMVYSLLSLIDPKEAEVIGSSYKRSLGEVFAQATFAAMTIQRKLEILRFVDIGTARHDDLPTWVLDFERFARREPESTLTNAYKLMRTRWPRHRNASDVASAFLADGRLLGLTVTFLDRISATVQLPLRGQLETHNYGATNLIEDITALLERAFALRTRESGAHCQPPWLADHSIWWNKAESSGEFQKYPKRASFSFVNTWVDTVSSVFSWWDDMANFPRWNREPWNRGPWDEDPPERGIIQGIYQSDEFHGNIYATNATRAKLFLTAGGLIGLGRQSLSVGDALALTTFEMPPIVLRSCGEHYTFRGMAYVHGIGGGELMEYPGLKDCVRDVRIA